MSYGCDSASAGISDVALAASVMPQQQSECRLYSKSCLFEFGADDSRRQQASAIKLLTIDGWGRNNGLVQSPQSSLLVSPLLGCSLSVRQVDDNDVARLTLTRHSHLHSSSSYASLPPLSVLLSAPSLDPYISQLDEATLAQLYNQPPPLGSLSHLRLSLPPSTRPRQPSTPSGWLDASLAAAIDSAWKLSLHVDAGPDSATAPIAGPSQLASVCSSRPCRPSCPRLACTGCRSPPVGSASCWCLSRCWSSWTTVATQSAAWLLCWNR